MRRPCSRCRATCARDQALLADAKLDLNRYEGLVKEDSIAVQQLDTQRALVAQYVGTIESDEGQLKTAQVNLVYTHIVSPISGRVGLRQVDQGNYVTPGDANGIVVINQVQPITVIFPVPEDNVPAIAKRLRDGDAMTVEAYDRANSAKLADGKLLTLDNAIDTTTGTVKLRALFDNADGALFPNQFVNIQLLQELLQHQIIIPNAAVRRGAPNGVVTHFRLRGEARPYGGRPPGHPRRRRRRTRGDRLGTRGRRGRGDRRRRPAARRGASHPAASNTGTTGRRRARLDPAGGHASRCRERNAPRAPAPHPIAMNPSRIFILRPVATTLLMVAILIVGAIAYKQLPLSALPEVAYPTIQVQTFYPGASPEVVTSAITAPLEKQFGQMPGLNEMSSTSSAGASVITLQFNLALAIDVAEQQVQAAISAAQNLLPQDLPAPPIYAKVNPADAPVLTLGITSKVMPLTEVEDLADTRIAQKISQLKGVGVVSISGGQRPAVRVVVNPRALAAYGLNLDDLRTTINNANQNGPKGTLDGPTSAYTVNTNDQIRNADDYGSIVIAYKNGAAVRLRDVATLVSGAENAKLGGWMNSTPALIMNVQRQPGANVVDVVDRIHVLLPSLQAAMPAGVDVAILTDRTTTIRASVADVEFELVLAVILVVLVIYVFLRNVPATIIPSLSVPLSLIGTFGVMYLTNFSLNNLSLMALTIATGFVVDDAIVMIENISRYIELGLPPLEAALKGAGQIGFTIISLTVSLIAVLIPLLFMQDVVGRLFREFAVTLAVTILISAVVSLTLVPMLCAKLLKHRPQGAQAQTDSGHWFSALVEWYGRRLAWVLEHQRLTLYVAAGTLALTAALYVLIPKGFFPDQDTGLIQGVSEAGESISYAAMAERQQALAVAILTDPDVQSLSSFIGVDGNNVTLNSGRFLINLKPRDQRTSNVADVIRRLRSETAGIAGITLYMQPVQDLTLDTTVSRTQYQFTLESADAVALSTWTPKLLAAAASAARTRRCRQQPGRQRSRRLRHDRPRQRRPARHQRGNGRQCALRCVRPADRLHHLHAVESVSGDSRGGSRVVSNRRFSRLDLRAVGGRRTSAAVGDRQGGCGDEAAAHQSSRPISGNHGVVQSRFGRIARRSRCRHRKRGAYGRVAAEHSHLLSGRRARVPQQPHQRTAAAGGRRARDVHRARRAVRELHSSHHDSLHAAVGRHRRAARADAGGR